MGKKQTKYNQLIGEIKDFNALIEMYKQDFKDENINLDKLLFNANCLSYELNKKIYLLKKGDK